MNPVAHDVKNLAFIVVMLAFSTGLLIRPRWFAVMTPLIRQTDADIRVGGIVLFPCFVIALILWLRG